MHIPILLFCFASLEARKRKDASSLPIPRNLDKLVEEAKDDTFKRPVDFLHVYREGFGDKDYKQPLHLLEEDMIQPKNREHAIQLLKNTDKHNIQFYPKEDTLIFNSPRDEFLYFKKKYELDKNNTVGNKENVYDFIEALERNLARPRNFERKSNEEEKNPKHKFRFEPRKTIADNFAEHGFFTKPEENHKMNWTTCDEFSEKALFYSQDIIDTEWLPFYTWSKRGFTIANVHRFSFPTKKRVKYYKTSFGPYVQNIDWSQPKLLLKERSEILLISTNRIGLFYGIPDHEVPTPEQGKVVISSIRMRIKIHSPYIAMMYCDEFYATIMAEQGTEPTTSTDKIKEASTLGFRGIGLPVYRDIENENMLAQTDNKRKLAAEERKIIKIKKIVGDVDPAVRH